LAAKALSLKSIPEERLSYIYRALTSQKPDAKALDILSTYYQDQREDLQAHPEKVEGWLEIGEWANASEFDRSEMAAYSIVSSMIMNSSAATNKR